MSAAAGSAARRAPSGRCGESAASSARTGRRSLRARHCRRSRLPRDAGRSAGRSAGHRPPVRCPAPARAGSAGTDESRPARSPGRCRRTGSWLPSAFSPGRSAGSRSRSTSHRRRRRRRTGHRARRAPCRACVGRVPWINSLLRDARPGQPFSDIVPGSCRRPKMASRRPAPIVSSRNKGACNDHGKSRETEASRLQVGGFSDREAEAGCHRRGPRRHSVGEGAPGPGAVERPGGGPFACSARRGRAPAR